MFDRVLFADCGGTSIFFYMTDERFPYCVHASCLPTAVEPRFFFAMTDERFPYYVLRTCFILVEMESGCLVGRSDG